jgi:hypothetical protein
MACTRLDFQWVVNDTLKQLSTGVLCAILVRFILPAGIAIAIIHVVALSGDAVAATSSDLQLESAKVHEGTIDFMVTTCFGLFAIFGFFLRDGLSSQPDRRCALISVGIAFIIFASASLILAYYGRIDLAHHLGSGVFLPEKLDEYYAWQGRTLLAAAASLLVFVGLVVYPKQA